MTVNILCTEESNRSCCLHKIIVLTLCKNNLANVCYFTLHICKSISLFGLSYMIYFIIYHAIMNLYKLLCFHTLHTYIFSNMKVGKMTAVCLKTINILHMSLLFLIQIQTIVFFSVPKYIDITVCSKSIWTRSK